MNEHRYFKSYSSIVDWFCYDSVPKRITKLEIKNENLAVSVDMEDSEVRETIAKLLTNFSKNEVIDIFTDILHEKND